jgi:two-component system, chemotaxis family, chemotaxis protein CheY
VFAAELRALVIDDQRAMRSIVRSLLYQIGIKKVTEAESGKRALESLKTCKIQPDFILCDLNMENIDGIQFIKLLRHDNKLKSKNAPIIFLTGEDDPDRLDLSYQAGAVDVVLKPCSSKDLARAIGKAIGYTLMDNAEVD